MAAGAAIGATALFAPGAQAADLQVNSTADHAADGCDAECTIRDALDVANGNGTNDRITFASDVTGTITLTQGSLSANAYDGRLTVNGPGADALTVSGDDATRVVNIYGPNDVRIDGLTFTKGSDNNGGAVLVGYNARASLTNMVISDNHATGSYGGGIASRGLLFIGDSEVSGNTAANSMGGGIFSGSGGNLVVARTTVSGNSARNAGGIDTRGRAQIIDSVVADNEATDGYGGGIGSEALLIVDSSEITGNSASLAGGGINQRGEKYGPLEISDSDISGNTARIGGGLSFNQGGSAKYGGPSTIDRTTIAGNEGTNGGGGVAIGDLNDNDRFTISHSTISENKSPGSEGNVGHGGGLLINGRVRADVGLLDSTISGNTATRGAGIAIGSEDGEPPAEEKGSIDFRNSTIASNTATQPGGGILLESYGSDDAESVAITATPRLDSTIVADNAPGDLQRDDGTRGGFDLSFSLVESPGDAPLFQHEERPSILGVDPQLGPLADNGGPTLTHLPARTSPAIEHGHGDPEDADQRGLARVVDNEDPNALNGDGTDIGAVELDKPPPKPMPENPPPQEQPPPPPPENPPPDSNPPSDLPPQAVISKNGLRSKKDANRFVAGIANDDHAVASVDVAIVRKRRNMCKQLLASGKFSKWERCGGPKSFLPADGTTKWRYDLKESLDRGYYVVYSRATDDSGRKQLSFGTKSRRPFRVR